MCSVYYSIRRVRMCGGEVGENARAAEIRLCVNVLGSSMDVANSPPTATVY